MLKLYYYTAGLRRSRPRSLQNWLNIEDAPDAYLYGSLLQAEPYLKNDSRVAIWRDIYGNVITTMNGVNTAAHNLGAARSCRGAHNMGGPVIPLVGFAPDRDPSQPGVIVDCQFLLPTVKGMKAAPTPTPARLPVLPAQTTGAATVVLLSGNARAFVGMPTQLYEAVANAWVDVTRVSLSTFNWAAGDPFDAHMEKPEVTLEDARAAGTPIPYTGTAGKHMALCAIRQRVGAEQRRPVAAKQPHGAVFGHTRGAGGAAAGVTQGFVFVANTTDANLRPAARLVVLLGAL